MEPELIDLETLIEMRKAAPKVTRVPFDYAQLAVNALERTSAIYEPYRDREGKAYWDKSLKNLVSVAGITNKNSTDKAIANYSKMFGTAYRMMGLIEWRKTDGYRVAWSEAQLKILKKHFGASK